MLAVTSGQKPLDLTFTTHYLAFDLYVYPSADCCHWLRGTCHLLGVPPVSLTLTHPPLVSEEKKITFESVHLSKRGLLL